MVVWCAQSLAWQHKLGCTPSATSRLEHTAHVHNCTHSTPSSVITGPPLLSAVMQDVHCDYRICLDCKVKYPGLCSTLLHWGRAEMCFTCCTVGFQRLWILRNLSKDIVASSCWHGKSLLRICTVCPSWHDPLSLFPGNYLGFPALKTFINGELHPTYCTALATTERLCTAP